MFGWLREFLDILQYNREVKLRLREETKERAAICPTCETLKVELSRERREKEMLLNHLLSSRIDAPVEERDDEPPMPIIRHKPWRVKQQELEAESRREKERVLAEFKDKVNKVNTEDLEKSIGI